MNAPARVYHLMRADFLERTRRYGFVIVMGLTLWAGYQMVPPGDASYIAFSIGGHRPYYSSAWVGTIFGTICGTLLTLIGFFLIRNSVGRDRDTRVGRIIAGTPTTRTAYVVGKWLSNLAVLAAVLAVLTLVAPLMQLLRGEDRHLDLIALAGPLWMIGLPPLALVAALAVFFETAPLLRGAIGSVTFVVLWGAVLVLPVGSVFVAREPLSPLVDVIGLSPSMSSLYAAAEASGIDVDEGVTDLFEPTRGREVRRFVWTGIAWPAAAVAERLAWIAFAFVVALAAALPFDRFDPARGRGRLGWKKRAVRAPPKAGTADARALASGEADVQPGAAAVRLTRLEPGRARNRLPALVRAELRNMIRGRAWWWWGATLALIITVFAVSARIRFLGPVLWLLPIGVWSAMGNREVQARTTAFVFSSPRPLERQMLATWLAGTAIGLIVAAITAVRPIISGDPGHLAGLLVGVVFVPSLALALGTWTGNGRAFEVVYVVLWWLGVMGRLTPFDFLGSSPRALEAGVPLYYAALAGLLLGVAAAGRRRQLLCSA